VALNWTSVFDTTFWEGWRSDAYPPPHCTWWDTDHWVPGDYFYNIHLKVTGSWATGYRADKIRLTLSETIPAPVQVFIRDASLNVIGEGSSPYYSGTEIILDFDGCGDIYEIYIPTGDTTTTCTNIEFGLLPSDLIWNFLDEKIFVLQNLVSLLMPSLFGHGLHILSPDPVLFQEVAEKLEQRIPDLSSDEDRESAMKILNFFRAHYGT